MGGKSRQIPCPALFSFFSFFLHTLYPLPLPCGLLGKTKVLHRKKKEKKKKPPLSPIRPCPPNPVWSVEELFCFIALGLAVDSYYLQHNHLLGTYTTMFMPPPPP
ncbi:hypothetical protein F4809DRAFT_615255 [Biscogniauxia mediterranea]|nr:hypothetical protein F4809DRAFT_615255 [Biscogniauxia mediterranea]